MRVKKQRRHRKFVRFYTACFGFRQPFKVLCDGTFVHHLIVNQIVPADKAISNIFGGPVKLFTTKCVLAELKRLGSSYSESLQAAQKLMTARCDHENKKTADACIREIIGENNQDHFFVGTQDADLRKKFQEIPGVPVVFGLRNALFLEQPSESQRQFVKSSEERRLHMTDQEYKMLKRRMKDTLVTGEDKPSSHESEGASDENVGMLTLKKKHPSRRGLEVKDKVRFKKKRAKGPNPLSCKKKKNAESSNPVSEKERKDGENSASRKRKRKRKSKKPVEADG